MKTLNSNKVELTDREIKIMMELLQWEINRIKELSENWDKRTQKRFKEVVENQITPLTDMVIKLSNGVIK